MGSGQPVKRVAGLLRAVNVGGRKLLMADLLRIARTAGFDAPTTLLASGNVLFGTTLDPQTAGAVLGEAIQADQGLSTDVLVRDHAQLTAVIAANPFPDEAAAAPNRMMALFLTGEPVGDLGALQAECQGGEAIAPGPGCLYMWFPEGAGTSKLSSALVERRLKLRGTARNWNTVSKLQVLLAV